MCRSSLQGGRRCPSVSSDRARQLNTANRRVSRARKVLTDHKEANSDGSISMEGDRLRKRLEDAEVSLIQIKESTIITENSSSSPGSHLPSHLVKTGKEFNEQYSSLVTTLNDEYNESKISTVMNRETAAAKLGVDTPLAKPYGGLWFSPTDEEGVSEWDRFNGEEEEDHRQAQKRYSLQPREDYTVLIIDSWEDYTAVVDSSNRLVVDHLSRSIGWEPDDRKGIDYDNLGVDIVFITQKGVSESSFAGSRFRDFPNGDDYESLYGWDIASGVLCNPKAMKVTPAY